MSTLEADQSAAVDPGTPLFVEQGANSPFTARGIEYNSKLYPREQALRTYEQMKRNDAQVRTALQASKIQVLIGDFYVQPAETGQPDLDAEIAEFVEYNLFDNMTIGWSDVMQHVMSKLDYGSSVFETVFEERAWRRAAANSNSRPMIMLRKLAPRPAHTVVAFLYDENGGPSGILHRRIDPTDPTSTLGWTVDSDIIRIDIDKLLIFVHDQEGGNLEGVSMLRTAYQPWYYKNNLYKIDAIQKERHGIGIPDITLPPGATAQDRQLAIKLARNMRTNEHAYILRPSPQWVIGFAKPEGQLTDALRSAEHHDLMIARNFLAQFLNSTGVASGSGQSGSRGNTATMMDLFLKWQRWLGNTTCDPFNTHLIPRLVELNYPKAVRYPKLQVRGIGESRDQQMVAAAIRNLVGENVISVDDEFEKYVRRIFDWPTTWDKNSSRVNESLLKPFTSPDGQPVARNPGAPTPPAKPTGTGRGPTTGNVPKAGG